MDGIRFCGCGCQTENLFVCFGAKPTQRACARDLPRDRKKMGEGRSRRQWARQNSQQKVAAETSRHERAVKRRNGSQHKGAEETSRQNRSVNRWESGGEETSQQKSERQLLGSIDLPMPGWPTREYVSIPSGFVEVSQKYTPAIACKCTESCTKASQISPLLGLELTQARLLVLLFFHALGCVFCVLVKKCEITLAGDEKNHETILIAMSSLVGWAHTNCS